MKSLFASSRFSAPSFSSLSFSVAAASVLTALAPTIALGLAIDAGPIWNNDHAQQVCPAVCSQNGGAWTGSWWTTIPNVNSVCQCDFQPTWKPAQFGEVPAYAVLGGQEPGRSLYVCRGEFNGGTHPGKLLPGLLCNIPYGEREIELTHYEVLVDPSVKTQWVRARNGAVPPKAVLGGQEPERNLFICRTQYNGGTHPGKLLPNDACNFSYGGRELKARIYDVLVTK
jgi:hypothetical protein